MTGNIEQRIYALARRYNGVYLINNEKKTTITQCQYRPRYGYVA